MFPPPCFSVFLFDGRVQGGERYVCPTLRIMEEGVGPIHHLEYFHVYCVCWGVRVGCDLTSVIFVFQGLVGVLSVLVLGRVGCCVSSYDRFAEKWYTNAHVPAETWIVDTQATATVTATTSNHVSRRKMQRRDEGGSGGEGKGGGGGRGGD